MKFDFEYLGFYIFFGFILLLIIFLTIQDEREKQFCKQNGFNKVTNYNVCENEDNKSNRKVSCNIFNSCKWGDLYEKVEIDVLEKELK